MKSKAIIYAILFGAVAHMMLVGCAVKRKLTNIESNSLSATLTLTKKESFIPEQKKLEIERDTLFFHDDEGHEMMVMKAIKDDETGEMVANDVLDAAVVTARFRNVAERQGKVDLKFQVIVPPSLQDSKWQLRFYPDMFIMQDSTRLDSVIVTGAAYRKAQLRGYQHYQRFIARMLADSSLFNNAWQLEVFLKRNLPEIYKFKNDTTEVEDTVFQSCFGVDEREAFLHYNKRAAKRTAMYKKYGSLALITQGIKLDTIIRDVSGDFIYNYTQTINSRPKLRKADIVLQGAIYEQGEKVYTMPKSDPLTFYISSISTFTDNSTHYLTKVIERQAEANAACRIDFEVGKTEIKPDLSDNAGEIGRIKGYFRSLLTDSEYDLDSITVNATASPEGSYQANKELAQRRSESVTAFFKAYVVALQDSLKSEEGVFVNVDETFVGETHGTETPKIKMISHSVPENWTDLTSLVQSDSTLTIRQKESYSKLLEKYSEPDKREQMLRSTDYYQFIRENIYPKLRTVGFNFFLHRKGMVKDTIHTTVVDSVYMEGVQALKDMDYNKAIRILGPYNDYNAAVAYAAMNRNLTAMQILQKMPPLPEVNYLMAVLYSRMGDWQNAVERYVRSCKQNSSFVYRGNLDPEISFLIKKYGLNQEPEDDLNTPF